MSLNNLNTNTQQLITNLSTMLSSILEKYKFEYNDSITRNAVKNQLDTFLQGVKSNRSLRDYKVICNETNNSPHLIDHHGLRVDVMIQPTASIQQMIPISIYNTDYIFHPPEEE